MVDGFVLSVAREAERYEQFGYPVVADDEPDQGPLAGIVSAVAAVQTPWILTTPADTPFLPANLVAALAPACARRGAAVVTAGGHRQNLSMLLDQRLAASLAEFYHAAGGRAVHRWLVANGVDEIAFPRDGFFNINTPQDLALARAETDRRSRGVCRRGRAEEVCAAETARSAVAGARSPRGGGGLGPDGEVRAVWRRCPVPEPTLDVSRFRPTPVRRGSGRPRALAGALGSPLLVQRPQQIEEVRIQSTAFRSARRTTRIGALLRS